MFFSLLVMRVGCRCIMDVEPCWHVSATLKNEGKWTKAEEEEEVGAGRQSNFVYLVRVEAPL